MTLLYDLELAFSPTLMSSQIPKVLITSLLRQVAWSKFTENVGYLGTHSQCSQRFSRADIVFVVLVYLSPAELSLILRKKIHRNKCSSPR